MGSAPRRALCVAEERSGSGAVAHRATGRACLRPERPSLHARPETRAPQGTRRSRSTRKAGRKVTHLVFDYAPKKQPSKAVGKAPAKSKAGKLTKEEVGRLARPGESWEAAYARLNQIQLELS